MITSFKIFERSENSLFEGKVSGIPLRKMDKERFEWWVGSENVINGKIKVFRGTNVKNAGLRTRDFVTTNKEYAGKYGPYVEEFNIPIKYLNYFSGVKGGDPEQLHSWNLGSKSQPTELIYTGENINESTLYGNDMNDYPLLVYHGTSRGHDFNSPSDIHNNWLKSKVKGTFFSTEKYFAAEYMGEWKGITEGKLYEVHLKPNLNLFDTKNLENCKLLIDKFGEFEDDVELYDGDDYIIDTPERLFRLEDNWFAIEYQKGCLKWLSKNYDGVIVFENMVKNVILFNPVKEKIISFEEI